MFNLKPLHYFVLLAETRNFGVAAARANLSQPALSNSIKTLEEQLGFKLFQRDERPVTLTAEGRELYPRAKDILFEARNLDRQILALKAGDAGHVRIGLVPTFAASLGGRILAACHRQAPGLSLDVEILQTSGLLRLLEAEEVELIVCDLREIADPSGLQITPLMRHGGGCYCRPGHPLLSGPTPSLHAIFDYGIGSIHLPRLLHQELAKQFVPPGDQRPFLQLECDNVMLLCDVAQQSDLVLITTHSSIEPAVRRGLLRRVGPALEGATDWAIATLRGRAPHPGAPRGIREILAGTGAAPEA